MKAIDEYRKLLVIVPHSDDECLISAGLMRRFIIENRQVDLCVATNGDYLAEDMKKGMTRLYESSLVAGKIGIMENHIHFLGYPDTGMDPKISFLYHAWKNPNSSKTSGVIRETYSISNIPEYHLRKHGMHAARTAVNAWQDLSELLHEIEPDLIVTTSPQDVHGDHAGLYYMIHELNRNRADILCGLVHSSAGDENWPLYSQLMVPQNGPQKISENFPDFNQRITIPIPVEMQAANTVQSEKFRLLSEYHTAIDSEQEWIKKFLYGFVRTDEIFWLG